ncbi:MAG: heme lyase CcmF/NrfE family subunit [Rickettsiales bacterium]|nr:heme lyase CcmF/NrfE family subunit [Rickettsiales bacterium]
MTINTGNIYLLALIIISLFTSIPFFSKKLPEQKRTYQGVGLQFIVITLALLTLMDLYISSDYRFTNVALNTHALVPIIYKITGIWGNHEGSMLLIIWLLCAINIIFLLKSKFDGKTKQLILTLQSVLVFLLSCFIYFVSNPFVMNDISHLKGHGFNPLLQDYTLAIHPPILYCGYIGLSIIFSSLIVGLEKKLIDAHFLRLLYVWIATPLAFLTMGISLGSWWAYRELGWGGFWFWDPVENISLVIWCTSISLLHIAKLSFTRQIFYKWTAFLGIISFILAILSLLLVRSGALVSVHSFAIDTDKGIGLALVLIIISTISARYWLKYQNFIQTHNTSTSFFSKDSGIILQNIFVMTTCLVILIALLYPVFLGIFTQQTISVGELFYTETLKFIFLPTIILMISFPFLKWEKDNIKKHLLSLASSLISATLATIAINYTEPISSLGANLYIGSSIACIISIILYCKAETLKKIPMILGHLGMIILILGAAFCWSWQHEENTTLSEKQKYQDTKGYEIILEKITYQQKDNYLSRSAIISLYKNKQYLGIAKPETRFYPIEQTFTHESSIIHTLSGDIYFTLGEITNNKNLSIKIKYKPFVYLVWCGSVLMVISIFMRIFTKIKNEKTDNKNTSQN